MLRHPELSNRQAAIVRPKDTAGSQKILLDYSPGLDGIQRDMPLQQALSRHGNIDLVQADVPYYWTVFNELLDGLENISPLVEAMELGCAYLSVDGLQLIYPNNKALVNAVRNVIPASYNVQIGIAEGKFPACLAALNSPPGGYQILTDDIGTFLKDMSSDVLPVSLKNRGKLHNFGLHTLGQVAVLPIGPLQAQFGLEGKQIWELARGCDDTPLHPRFMKETIEESTSLLSVTTSVEAIIASMEYLLSRAFVRIAVRGMGIRSLTIWTCSWSAEHWEHNIRFKEPAMDTAAAISRIKHSLESFPQPGPVEQLGIKVTLLGCCSGKQKNLFPEIRATDHLMEDIKQLDLRLGSPQVYKVKEIEPWSRIPERRYALVPLSR